MIESRVIEVLEDSAVAELVGSRIYALVRPQGDELPAVVWQRISTVPVVALSGDSGLDAVRLQIAVYATTLLEAREVASAVRAALVGNLRATTEMILDDRDEETKNFRVLIDFNLWERPEES